MLSRAILIFKLPMFLLLFYLIPFAFLLWFVTSFGVNVPYADQWEMVPLFQNIISGKATFQLFFAQQNEHRILFPKLIISALALLSGWNIQLELYFSVALAAIMYLSLLKISFDQAERHNQLFHIANISTCLIVFSVVQWENWLWGFQIAWFLVDACLVVAVLALSSSVCTTLQTKFTVAAVACFIASFSLAHGLLTWIAVVPSLRSCCKDFRQFRKASVLWLGLFLAACVLYFIGYHKPPQTPDLWFVIKEPRLAANYFLTLLGSPLACYSGFSEILGLVTLASFGFFVVRYVKKAGSSFSNDAAPWISLGCFVILFSLMTTVGRAGFGVAQASTSRYTTITILLLVALVQLWQLMRQTASKTLDPAASLNDAKDPKGLSNTLIIGVLTSLVMLTSINSLPLVEVLRSRLQYGQVCLEAVDYVARSLDNCIQLLYPEIELQSHYPNIMSISDRTKILNRIGFRRFPGRTIKFVTEPTKDYGHFDTSAASKIPAIVRKNCLNCGMLNVNGWAVLPEQNKPAQLVFLGLGHQPEAFLSSAYVHLSSPDVAKALGIEKYNRARWQTTISPQLFPLGETLLTAWVYDSDGKQFIKLNGEQSMNVEE